MRLSFDSIDEVKEFVKGLKGTRGGKAGDNDDGAGPQTGGQTAPALLQPPTGQTFNPGAGGAAFNPGGAAGFSPVGVAPEVTALVNRIVARADALVAGGQDANAMLTWFRTQCGPEAAQATLDQIKTVFLSKASVTTLTEMVKLIGA